MLMDIEKHNINPEDPNKKQSVDTGNNILIEVGRMFELTTIQEEFDPYTNVLLEVRKPRSLVRIIEIRHEEDRIVCDFNNVPRFKTDKHPDFQSIDVQSIIAGRLHNRAEITPI